MFTVVAYAETDSASDMTYGPFSEMNDALGALIIENHLLLQLLFSLPHGRIYVFGQPCPKGEWRAALKNTLRGFPWEDSVAVL